MSPEQESEMVEWVEPQMFESIEDISETAERVAPEEIAAALGARDTGFSTQGIQGPFQLFGLRRRLFRDIISAGVSPSLKGETTQKKIKVRTQDWEILEKVAAELSTKERKITPTHLAGVLVSQAVADMQAFNRNAREDQ